MENQEKSGKPAGPRAVAVDAGNESRLIVVDFGKKQSGKKIRRLRKGQGPLLDDVKALVENTKENIGAKDVLPIVIVVQKKRNNRLFW